MVWVIKMSVRINDTDAYKSYGILQHFNYFNIVELCSKHCNVNFIADFNKIEFTDSYILPFRLLLSRSSVS